jgi:hypothetical protein
MDLGRRRRLDRERTSVPAPAARYLDRGYLAVRGMSSLFAARIIVGLLARQTAAGVAGHVAEIGVFEGRLLIAMALALADGERALAVGPFTWPDPGVRGRFEANCAAHTGRAWAFPGARWRRGRSPAGARQPSRGRRRSSFPLDRQRLILRPLAHGGVVDGDVAVAELVEQEGVERRRDATPAVE